MLAGMFTRNFFSPVWSKRLVKENKLFVNFLAIVKHSKIFIITKVDHLPLVFVFRV